MSQEHEIGERRRRREAERAARAAAGSDPDRPLTRRELRAREAALSTGAIAIDETGELRVVKPPEPVTQPDPLDGPATGAIGLTRRQLRALREQQRNGQAPSTDGAAPQPGAASAGSPAADVAEPTPARGTAAAPEPRSPVAPERVEAAVQPTPAPVEPARPAPPAEAAVPAARAEAATPAEAAPAAPAPVAPAPPVRRPVVRPPAAAAGVRSLADDGTGLTPVVRDRAQEQADAASPTAWLSPTAAVDVTGALDVTAATVAPASEPTRPRDADRPIVPDPGPLPTTRRTRRVADESMEAAAASDSVAHAVPTPPPSLDEVITGNGGDPKPFPATPSWRELPPPTPAEGMSPVAAPREPAAARGETEVIAATPAPRAQEPEDPYDAEDLDDLDEDDEHHTPRWLTALMVLVLIVIGIVLGLLVWRLFQGEGDAGAAEAMTGWVTMQMGAV